MAHAHKHSQHNKNEISKSSFCGCFCCCRIFPPEEIKEWIDNNDTAICPHCGVDAVIGNSSGISITKPFLIDMYQKWFIV